MRYGNLQALRFLAAMAVLLGHLRSQVWSLDIERVPRYLILGPFEEAGGVRLARMGVILFFSLSGFLMQKSLSSGREVSDFAISRFFRIVPLYWVSIAFMAASGLTKSTVDRDWLIASMTFTSQLISETTPVNSVGWTLEYEMYFYLLVAVGLTFGKNRRLRMLAPPLLLVISILGGLEEIAIYFLVGQFAFFIVTKIQGASKDSVTRKAWLISGSVAAALSIVPANGLDPYSAANIPAFATLNIFLLVLAVSLPQVRWAPILLLGDASYSIYLWHMPLFLLLQPLVGGLHEFVQVGLLLASSLLFAVTSWLYLEGPILRLGRWLGTRRRRNEMEVTP